MTPDMIHQLPPKYALVMPGGLAPVIAHAPIAWHDCGYLLARNRSQPVATLRALPRAQGTQPRQAVPPVDRWAPVDHTPAAHGPAGTVNGPTAQGRLPWDAPVDGNGTNGGRTPAGGRHEDL